MEAPMDKPAFDAEARATLIATCKPVGSESCWTGHCPCRDTLAAAFQRIHASRQPEIDAALAPDAFIETLENAADQPARLTPYQIASLLLGAASRLRRPPPPPAPAERERLARVLETVIAVPMRLHSKDAEAIITILRALPASGTADPTKPDPSAT